MDGCKTDPLPYIRLENIGHYLSFLVHIIALISLRNYDAYMQDYIILLRDQVMMSYLGGNAERHYFVELRAHSFSKT